MARDFMRRRAWQERVKAREEKVFGEQHDNQCMDTSTTRPSNEDWQRNVERRVTWRDNRQNVLLAAEPEVLLQNGFKFRTK